jgi:hypothetical protein
MARPLKQTEEKRAERFNLRFTLEEAERLKTQAATAGIPPHEYARRRVLGFQVQPPPQKADAALVSELNRIGVNVNQLARAQNGGREFRGDWQDVERDLRSILEKVAAAYGS